MAYTVPEFNLTCDVWSDGHLPSEGDPDYTGVACQFYWYSRGPFPVDPCNLELYCPPLWVRMPIAAGVPWQHGQVFECPSGSGLYYRARFKDVMHRGFINEYLVAIVVQCGDDGRPVLRFIEDAVPCGDTPPGDHVGEGIGEMSGLYIGTGEAEVIHAPIEHDGDGVGDPHASYSGEGSATVS